MSTRVIQTFNTRRTRRTGDTNDDPNTAPQLAGNSLYVSHLTQGDTDYYKIPIGAFGSRVELTLSHIAAGSDYDLAVAGPPAPRLRTPPADTIPLGNQQLPDSNVSTSNHRAQPLPPETLQDIPIGELTAGGRVLRAVSDNRGNGNEHITLVSQGEGRLLHRPDHGLSGRLARSVPARGEDHPGARLRPVRAALDREHDDGRRARR